MDKENWRKGNRFDISTKFEEKKENGEVVTDLEQSYYLGSYSVNTNELKAREP